MSFAQLLWNGPMFTATAAMARLASISSGLVGSPKMTANTGIMCTALNTMSVMTPAMNKPLPGVLVVVVVLAEM